MKKNKAISLLLVLVLLITTFSSCIKSSAEIFSYGDVKLYADTYAYYLAYLKSIVLKSITTNELEFWANAAEPDFYGSGIDCEGKTNEQVIVDIAKRNCMDILIVEHLFKKYDLKLTQEDIKTIDEEMNEIYLEYEGEDYYALHLAKFGATIKTVRQINEYSYKRDILISYLYEGNGERRIPDSTIRQELEDNYISFDYLEFKLMIADPDDSSAKIPTFSFEKEELMAYFKEHYVKVKHILYATADLSEEEIIQEKEKADLTAEKIISGEATIDELKDETDDGGFEYIFTTGKMVAEFNDAAFEMEVNEVRNVKTQFGYHVMQKMELLEEDYDAYAEEAAQNMSNEKVVEFRKEIFEKIQEGSIDFAKDHEEELYVYSINSVLMPKSQLEAMGLTILNEMSNNEYYSYDFISSGVLQSYMITRKLDITDDDFEENYSKLSETLINNAFNEYIDSLYDSIEIINAELEKFDIKLIEKFS